MKLLLVGCGAMAVEYAKVLSDLKIDFRAVGRGENNIKKFQSFFPAVKVYGSGLENNTDALKDFTHAIVATNVVSLCGNTEQLLNHGVKNILVEKPGFATPEEALRLNTTYKNSSSDLYVAYNRRFLTSVLKAKEMIAEDGGVLSFNFEFTEWSHVIEKLECPDVEKNYLFLANSTHVVDLAFFLGGKPKQMNSFLSGKLSWHESGAVFSGAGKTDSGALFSYAANWLSAGRWGVEILTQKRKLIFRPLEKLQIQEKGSVAINFQEQIDYTLDERFKPGLYRQTEAFISGNTRDLCSFDEQMQALPYYRQISGY